MANKFAVVGVAGLGLSVVCLAAAAAVGGKALSNVDWDTVHWDDWGRPACHFAESGAIATRAVDWDEADKKAAIGISANVHYRPGTGTQAMVTGDPAIISHVQVEDGNVRMDCRGRYDGKRLEITLPGRPFEKFEIGGATHVTLEALDQTELHIEMGGANHLTASGKTGNLHIEMGGANQADLGELQADKGHVEMGGSNEAIVSVKGDLDVEIGGFGKVTLRIEPHRLTSHIGGAGQIIHPGNI